MPLRAAHAFLLLLLFAAAAARPGLAQSPEPSSPPPIRVLAQDSTVRYGQAVELAVRVESAVADITSIKAYYRPRGTRTITTYGYAAFSPGRDVTARLAIPAAGLTYYPPGVVFEVRYEITDAAGNQLETDPLVVEYLDPAFHWKRLSKDGLTVIYHDREEVAVDRLMDEAAARVARVEETVGADPGGAYRAVLFNSSAEARRAFPLVSQTAADGHVFAGFAYEQYGLFVLDHAGSQGVTHELTHLIFGRATNVPAAKRPAWLNEGLAVYFETESRATTMARLRTAVRDGTLLPLRAMNSIPGRPEQINVFYPQAGNFVGYLIEQRGEEGMRSLVAAMRGGALPSEAALAAYGTTIDELEAGWRRDIGARPEDPPPANPAAEPAGSGAAAPTPAFARPGPMFQAAGQAAGAAGTAGSAGNAGTASTPRSLTVLWLGAGLASVAAVLVAVYGFRHSRRGAR